MSDALAPDLARLGREALVSELVDMASGGWDPSFQGDVVEVAGFALARALAVVTAGVDCVISFGRVPLAGVTVWDPARRAITPEGGYPVLRERLRAEPGYDSVPLAVGVSGRGTAVWDGHRRLETYRAARRPDFPAWIATFRRGRGTVRVS